MRSSNKSSTLRSSFTSFDGNKHDSVISGSIITRGTGYDVRATLSYPFEVGTGAPQDAVLKRGSISTSTFISADTREDLPILLQSFFAVAKRMDLIDNQAFAMDTADIWAELTADFTKMIANLAVVQSNTGTKRDPDAAYIVEPRPQIVGTNP